MYSTSLNTQYIFVILGLTQYDVHGCTNVAVIWISKSDPVNKVRLKGGHYIDWIPAFAGMTTRCTRHHFGTRICEIVSDSLLFKPHGPLGEVIHGC